MPDTVRLLRQRRGLTLGELGANLNKQHAWASKVEHGHIELRGQNLQDCAAALGVPPGLLCTPIPEADLEGLHFRKYRIPKKVEDRAAAEANFVAYLVHSLLIKGGQRQAPVFPQLDARELGHDSRAAGAAAARIVREHWDLGDGPVRHLAEYVESDGVFVAPLPGDIGRGANPDGTPKTGSSKVGAITVWRDPNRAPITLLSKAIAEDTRRFTLAHELAHLVMDTASGPADDKDVEARADAFAGELLAPYAAIAETIRGLDLGKFGTLVELQQAWGLHPKAFIRRGFLEGDISANAQSRWFRFLNGARRHQVESLRSPYPLKVTAIGALLHLLKTVDWTAPSLAGELHVHVSELAAVLDAWPFKVGITPAPQPSTSLLAAIR